MTPARHCPHDLCSWCLECVAALQAERDRLARTVGELTAAFAVADRQLLAAERLAAEWRAVAERQRAG